ncbi:MAG: flagellar hook-length control protein FliK [bacterium]|jgi:hypothetical protein
MALPVSGGIVSVPAAAAVRVSGRELRPGDVVVATVRETGQGTVVLCAGRGEMTARTEIPFAVGQTLRLAVESNGGGVLILKVAGQPDGAAGQSLTGVPETVLRELGLPDTAAGRQAVAALLAQRLPLERETVLALTRAAGNAAADMSLLAFLAARGLPLTDRSLARLEELFAGRWLAEDDYPPAESEAALRLERMTLPAPPGEAADNLAELPRLGRELAARLRAGNSGLSPKLSESLEICRRLNADAAAEWGFLPALAGAPGGRTPLLIAVKSFRRRARSGGEAELRVNLLLTLPCLGRLCARLRLRDGTLTCRLQVEDAAVQQLADAASETLAAALRESGYRAKVLPCTVGRLDWLAEFWGGGGGAGDTIRRVDLTV